MAKSGYWEWENFPKFGKGERVETLSCGDTKPEGVGGWGVTIIIEILPVVRLQTFSGSTHLT